MTMNSRREEAEAKSIIEDNRPAWGLGGQGYRWSFRAFLSIARGACRQKQVQLSARQGYRPGANRLSVTRISEAEMPSGNSWWVCDDVGSEQPMR